MPPFPRVDVESQGRLSPYRVDKLTTLTVPNAGDGVGFRGELGKYYLLLFCDTVTQSLLLAEHIVCGNEMFTQKQGHYFFQNNSILSVVLNTLLEGRRKSFCPCRRVVTRNIFNCSLGWNVSVVVGKTLQATVTGSSPSMEGVCPHAHSSLLAATARAWEQLASGSLFCA